MPLRLRSIRAKFLAVFVAGAVLPLALLSAVAYVSSLRSVTEMVGNRSARLAQSLSRELAQKLELRAEDRLLVANQPVQAFLTHAQMGARAAGPPPLAPLQDFLTALFGEYGEYYDELILADATGRPLAHYDRIGGLSLVGEKASTFLLPARPSVPRGATAGTAEPMAREGIVSDLAAPIREADRAALKQALDLPNDGHRLLADPVVAGAPPTVTLLWPVQANDRPYTRIGHLLARVRAGYLWSGDWPARRFGERGHLAVVDSATGDVLYHTHPGWIGRPLRQVNPALHEAVFAPRHATEGRPWTALGRGAGRQVASLAAVPGTSWQVAATAAPAEFASESQRAALFNLVVAIAALLAGAGVLVYASARISRSIHTLTAGARRIAGGDLSERVIRVETHDEVQTLAEAFNAMTASLRRSIALRDQAATELDALNRSLETRVQERTRELEELNAALNRANAELTELDRLKSNFLATVSHEFKTPLTSIKAFAEILHDELEQQGAPAEMRRFLRIIDSESDRLARLIKNVLDLSRIESGRMVWKMTDFPVCQVIDAAVDGLLPALQQKQIQLERELAAGEARVHADQDRLQEVLANVLDNAIKASEAGQRIVIGCQAGEANGDGRLAMLRIWVRDFGHGIPAEQLEKIFDRFHQVSTHGRRRKGGTGLGLAISREITEHHGGRIWAESEPGHGATFHIALPLAAAAPPRAAS